MANMFTWLKENVNLQRRLQYLRLALALHLTIMKPNRGDRPAWLR
jgi:hypothetical protein